MAQLMNRNQRQPTQPDLNQTNQLLGAILERVGGGVAQAQVAPQTQPQAQMPGQGFDSGMSSMPMPQAQPQQQAQMSMPSQPQTQPQFQSQGQGNGFAPNFFNKLGEGDHRTPFGSFLAKMGIPLAATAAGLASERALPGAAGLTSGFNAGTQQSFENKISTREQDRKDKFSSSMTDVPEGFEAVGYDQKGQPMIRKIRRDVSAEKFDYEKEQQGKQQENKDEVIREQAVSLLDTIDEVEGKINYFGTFGSVPSIPGTKRYDWESNVNKLLSDEIIKVMTDMKEASRTGSTGFGQLSNKELEVLRQSSTALKKSTSPQDAKKYLDKMRSTIQKGIQGGSSGSSGVPKGQTSSGENDFSNMSDDELRAIANGAK